MPVYAAGVAKCVFSGDTRAVINAESIGDGNKSEAIALQDNVDLVNVQMSFASAPGACSYWVQTAVRDVEALYVDRAELTDVNGETVDIASFGAKFLRIRRSSQTGGGVATIEVTPKKRR